MEIAAVDLLARQPDPSRDEVRAALSGNLCRCTGYVKIVDAICQAGSATGETAP
jgi:carbon-monoxide dehydrogenase small subunit